MAQLPSAAYREAEDNLSRLRSEAETLRYMLLDRQERGERVDCPLESVDDILRLCGEVQEYLGSIKTTGKA